MNELLFLPSPNRVYLVDKLGERKAPQDASHLVFSPAAQLGFWQDDHKIWLQPVGFLSSSRKRPWMLFTTEDFQTPGWTSGELICSALAVLTLCGLDVESERAMPHGTKRIKINPSPPRICEGAQIRIDRETGHIVISYVGTMPLTRILTKSIASPFVTRPNEKAWRKWLQQVVELFALGGVTLAPMSAEASFGVILKVFLSRAVPESNLVLNCNG
jgi:hypothetical protein